MNDTYRIQIPKLKTVTKKDIAIIIAHKIGMAQSDVKTVIDSFLEEIKAQFRRNTRVEIRGFGSFIPYFRKACKYRDPTTGEKKIMESRRTLRFKTSRNLFIFRRKAEK